MADGSEHAAVLLLTLLCGGVHAGAITTEPDGRSYHYVSHYSVAIDAPAASVWQHLVQLRSWMYELELSHVSGTPGAEGEVLKLYPDQDFFIQVTRQIPDRLLVIANLPATFRDELGTGVGVITLNEAGGVTTVDLTMSRRYTWLAAGPDPNKAERASEAFNEATERMWQERFLGRLRALAEQE